MRFQSVLLCASLAAPLLAQRPIRLAVDATEAPNRIFHVQMNMEVPAGPATLLYPQWIPGEHEPSGPVVNLVGLKIACGTQSTSWRRDDVNMFAFHIQAPACPAGLAVAFDFISPPESQGFSSGSSTTTELAVVSWNQLLLYPQGANADTLQYQATLRIPSSWQFGTALPVQRAAGGQIEFLPSSLTTLIDSPVSAGRWYRTVELGTDRGAAHFLHLAGDSAASVEMDAASIAAYKNLVAETGALFGSRHYRSYHFLLTLSDHVAHFGLEHHESSDDRVSERALLDSSLRKMSATLLPHEFVHSWNGKYRRPAGLVNGQSDGGYDFPMKGELLWIYEGLTNYLGEILAPRAGLQTPEEFRETLAMTAASMDRQSGRTWRPLEDTAVAAQILYEVGDDYRDYRRSVDYYPEGTLIWLDADVEIRTLSKGAKSLDDFCRAFHGGQGGAPAMKPYTLEDVTAALDGVQPRPGGWTAFFRERLSSTSPRAPLGGVERGGWKLVYSAEPTDTWKAAEEERKLVDLSYSLGITVSEEGNIIDVAMGGPAQKAGVAPSVKLIAVNNRQFTPAVLREAVKASASGPATLELLLKSGEYYETHRVDYSGGEKYPRLERDPATPDTLSSVIAPGVKR